MSYYGSRLATTRSSIHVYSTNLRKTSSSRWPRSRNYSSCSERRYSLTADDLPPGLVHSPFIFIASTNSLLAIGSLASARPIAAALREISFLGMASVAAFDLATLAARSAQINNTFARDCAPTHSRQDDVLLTSLHLGIFSVAEWNLRPRGRRNFIVGVFSLLKLRRIEQ